MQHELNQKNHCVYSLNYHLVLVTKYRKKCITPPVLYVLKNTTEERLTSWDSRALEINAEQDHVHILFQAPPNICLSELINVLKTNTSRIIRRDFKEHLEKYYWKPVFWSKSYCIISAGGAPLHVLKKYIENLTDPQ